MEILFCSNPLDNKTVDPDFQDEWNSVQEQGLTIHLFSFEDLTQERNAERATKKIKFSDSIKTTIYRGWMLKPVQYNTLYDCLSLKNYQLINTPTQYQNCHYLPDSYRFIKERTPKTVWLKVENGLVNYDELFERIATFNSSPLIVKDYVKSQKHYWDTACYIPSATDKNKIKTVVDTFVQLQDTDLNEGLVFREFVELNDLAIHSKSNMPLKQEYRLFFLNGQLVGCYDYWDEGDYAPMEAPPVDLFIRIAQSIESNFFTMDIAKTKAGEWTIIELGDGQVAGLPDKADRNHFYNSIGQSHKQ